MLATLLLSVLAPAPVAVAPAASQDPPIRIEINNDRQFERGDRAKVKIRTDDDGFLVVLHADPDGRVRVLFPLDPDDDNYVRGHHTYELRDRADREAFTVEASSGYGAIYAAVSRDPFRFEAFTVNNHWDYDALNAQDPGTDAEPVLGDIVQRMASGRYDYDYITYDVYENSYASVAYVAPASLYTPAYYYCDPVFDYYCDSYYYSPSRFSVTVGFGSPYYYRPWYYDPYYYGGYYGGYYRPSRYYGYPVYIAPGGPNYRPRYSSALDYKLSERRWDGLNYRDRLAGTPLQSVNAAYNPAPVRRGTTTGDMGSSPVAETPMRRRTATPTTPEPRRVERPSSETTSRPAPERREAAPSQPSTERAAPSRSRPSSDRATPSRRRDESRSQGAPELQRRTEQSAPIIERRETERRPVTVSRPEPRRAEPSRSVSRPAESRPSQMPTRSEPAPRMSAPPPQSSAPAARGGEGGGAGGRRGPR
jgi:hypothetical protein